jgi:MFS family permease
MTRARVLSLAVAAAVAIAFADSSIVVLALPELYLDFDTSIVGISWVITSYNLVVAVLGIALVPLSRRIPVPWLAALGLTLFLAGSIGCGVAPDLAVLIVFRIVQGIGAAFLLSSSLRLLVALTGFEDTGIALWAAAGTLGAAFGPALGGVLTEVFTWRAIFVAQAPVAALALAALLEPHVWALRPAGAFERPRHLFAPNLGLLLVFAALVGALFLGVLLIVTVWQFSPITGALVVSVLPAAAVLIRPVGELLPPKLDVASGCLLLAGGLAALALLPASSAAYAAPAFAICGAGLGLVLPPLTRASVTRGAALTWSSTLSVASRHAGLVVALVIIAPLLANQLEKGGERATLNATGAILDARIPLTSKIPIALALRDEFETTPEGSVPDLETPFAEHGADTDPEVAEARDSLLEAIRSSLTRAFRPAFLASAGFALLALIPGLIRRRAPT